MVLFMQIATTSVRRIDYPQVSVQMLRISLADMCVKLTEFLAAFISPRPSAAGCWPTNGLHIDVVHCYRMEYW